MLFTGKTKGEKPLDATQEGVGLIRAFVCRRGEIASICCVWLIVWVLLGVYISVHFATRIKESRVLLREASRIQIYAQHYVG